MGIQLKPTVQGSHSTPIDTGEYACLVLEKVGHIEIDETVELQIRHVHLPRHRHSRGVHVVSYGTVCRRSIELDMYDGTATGRPGKLFTRTDECMGLILKALSLQKYHSWNEFLKREQEIGPLNLSAQVPKLFKRSETSDPAKFRKNALSLLRKSLYDAREPMAMLLLEKFSVGARVEIDVLVKTLGLDSSKLHLYDLVLFLEQFGLINRVESDRSMIEMAPHSIDLANAMVDRLNKEDYESWRAQQEQLGKKLRRLYEEEDTYRTQLKECEARRMVLESEMIQKERQKPISQMFYC